MEEVVLKVIIHGLGYAAGCPYSRDGIHPCDHALVGGGGEEGAFGFDSVIGLKPGMIILTISGVVVQHQAGQLAEGHGQRNGRD